MSQFTVKLEKQNLATLSMIDNLKTLGCFVDVSLVCEGHTVKAHKLVLAAGSPFFRQLFLDNPCQHPIIIMQDVRYTILKEVIRFLYTGELSVSSQSLKALLKTVKTLDVKVLIDLCNESLCTSSSLESMSFREYDPVEITHFQKEPPQSTSMPSSQIVSTDQTVTSNSEAMVDQLLVKIEPPMSPLANSEFFSQSANKSDSEVIIGPNPLKVNMSVPSSEFPELLPVISDTRTLKSHKVPVEQTAVDESLMENVACEYDDHDMAEESDILNQSHYISTIPVRTQTDGDKEPLKLNQLITMQSDTANKHFLLNSHLLSDASFPSSTLAVAPSTTNLSSQDNHWPIVGTARRCAVCSKRGIQKRTKVSCKQCNVGLCIRSDCFELFHEAQK